MLMELRQDFDIAREHFALLFPSANFDRVLKAFNKSEFAVPNFYAYPIYSEDGWQALIDFYTTNN